MNKWSDGGRRPYAKWERLSAGAVAAVALIAITIHRSSSLETSETTHGYAVSSTTSDITSSKSPRDSVETPKAQLVPGVTPNFTPVSGVSTDFPGTALDTSIWTTYNGPGNANVGLRRPSAISVGHSELTITAKANVSGGLAQRHGQTYGRWVVRAKMDKGVGYGPAILLWPDSERWPQDGEIDIVELPDGNRSEAVMTTHYGSDNRQLSQSVFGDYSQWHTYAVDWTPTRIVYYIDGVVQFQITDPMAIPNKSMHLALQNDIGACDSWIGCRDSTTPATVALHVSSVRVYSYKAPAVTEGQPAS